jgi:hypothetical protein
MTEVKLTALQRAVALAIARKFPGTLGPGHAAEMAVAALAPERTSVRVVANAIKRAFFVGLHNHCLEALARAAIVATGHDPIEEAAESSGKPSVKRRATHCENCGKPLQRKRGGRSRRFCSDRCRDQARMGRNFSTLAVARDRSGPIPRNDENWSTQSNACKGDFGDRGSTAKTPPEDE